MKIEERNKTASFFFLPNKRIKKLMEKRKTVLGMLIIMRGVGSNPTGKFVSSSKWFFFWTFWKNYVKLGFNLWSKLTSPLKFFGHFVAFFSSKKKLNLKKLKLPAKMNKIMNENYAQIFQNFIIIFLEISLPIDESFE